MARFVEMFQERVGEHGSERHKCTLKEDNLLYTPSSPCMSSVHRSPDARAWSNIQRGISRDRFTTPSSFRLRPLSRDCTWCLTAVFLFPSTLNSFCPVSCMSKSWSHCERPMDLPFLSFPPFRPRSCCLVKEDDRRYSPVCAFIVLASNPPSAFKRQSFLYISMFPLNPMLLFHPTTRGERVKPLVMSWCARSVSIEGCFPYSHS